MIATGIEQIGLRLWEPRSAVGEIVDPTVDAPSGSGVYGFQAKGFPRPETLAPREEDAGGFLFLPANVSDELVSGLVGVSGLLASSHAWSKKYAVQVLDAPEGMEAQLGYMRKLVICGRMGLRFLFHSITEQDYSNFPDQPVTPEDLIKAFISDERSKYGLHFGNRKLAGKFGGDGNYAQEALAFGFSIDNSYHGLVSVWSRAWLCTK